MRGRLVGATGVRYPKSMSAQEFGSPRWLLVKTCQDLATKAKSPDLYGKLRMAGLIRHLLVGSHALADRVAKERSASLEFWYREPPEDGSLWKAADGFDASRRVMAQGESRRTGKDELLNARVAFIGAWWTVGQLIAAIDHFYGGASPAGLEGVSRETMLELDRSVRSGSVQVPVILQEINGVVLRALLPFAEVPEGAREPLPELAPTGSACPFGGKLALE
jgi:hypothetical protein